MPRATRLTAPTGDHPSAALPAGTHPGAVRLTVADADRVGAFYATALGLSVGPAGPAGAIALGVDGSRALVELVENPHAPVRPAGSTGLYHLAVLYPSRPELALALRRLDRAGVILSGASDHHVSESLYLTDPEGNGIELTRDRSAAELARRPRPRSITLPLDLEGLLGELDVDADVPEGAGAGPRIGHVHLQVADIRAATAFWQTVIGFTPTVTGVPQAAFLAAGRYHHHLGLNAWESRGGSPPPPGSRGLDRFELRIPGSDALAALWGRLDSAGSAPELDAASGGILVRDPSANTVLLRPL